jgi:hypothetical protein
MKTFPSRQLASMIGFAILALVILYANKATEIIRGLPFLMGSVVLCIQSIVLSRAQKTWATVFSLAALQFFILGFFNTSIAGPSSSFIHIAVDAIMGLLFLGACYYIATIADDERQADGYKAVNFFGYPRSRKLLIVIFGGYCTFLPVVIMYSIFSLSSNPWIPAGLKAADMSILMTGILSLITYTLIASRYKGLSSTLKRGVLIMLVFITASVIAIRLTLGGDNYALIVSIITATIVALSTIRLTTGFGEGTGIV